MLRDEDIAERVHDDAVWLIESSRHSHAIGESRDPTSGKSCHHALRRELANAMTTPFRHIQISVLVDGQTARLVESSLWPSAIDISGNAVSG